jgi:hypothetical protein
LEPDRQVTLGTSGIGNPLARLFPFSKAGGFRHGQDDLDVLDLRAQFLRILKTIHDRMRSKASVV